MAQAFRYQHGKTPRHQPRRQCAVFRLRHLRATQHVLRRGVRDHGQPKRPLAEGAKQQRVRRGVRIGRGDQPWLVPSPDPDTAAHALLFRPLGEGPFRLAVIAHASTQNVLRRAQMPQPEYRALAAWLVARGFAVLVPERLGHGATGGRYLENQGGCDEADYSRSGRATADAIALALDYLRKQSFIRQ